MRELALTEKLKILKNQLFLNISRVKKHDREEEGYFRGENVPDFANKILIHYDKLYCDPWSIRDGDSIYCDTHQLYRFKNILNKRKNLTIFTHNSDHYVCDGICWDEMGVNTDLFTCFTCWFAQNSYSTKSNVIPLPIGFENKRWEKSFGPKTKWLSSVSKNEIEPTGLIYFNCSSKKNPPARNECIKYAKQSDLVTIDEPNLHYTDYLRKIQQHKFILSPKGNGLECHRTWEALKMKRIPILKREGQLEKLYADMPVLFIDEWSDLKDMNLHSIYSSVSFLQQEYLNKNHWSDLIERYAKDMNCKD